MKNPEALPPRIFFRRALHLAREAAEAGEVPVGSVLLQKAGPPLHNIQMGESDSVEKRVTDEVTRDQDPSRDVMEGYRILAEERNRILERNDPTAHAELLAVRSATLKLGSERLPESLLITTLEPCLMCTGALVFSRVERVYYLTTNHKVLGMEEILNYAREHPPSLNHFPEMVHMPEYEEEAATILRNFFQKRRKGP